jgi:O-antigen ligase
MMSSIINFFNVKNLLILIFYSLPIVYILGSPFVNFILVISSFIFIIINFKLGNWDWLKNNSSIFFLIFWFYIVLLSFFSTDIYNSFRGSFFFIRFFLFMNFVAWALNEQKNLFKSLNFWLIIILLVSLDIYYQFIFGVDIFGHTKQGVRLAGPFGDELIAGAYLTIFTIIIFCYSFLNRELKNKIFFYLSIFLIVFAIVITGERLSFLQCLFFFFLFFLIVSFKYKKIKFFFTFFVLSIISIFLLYNFNEGFQSRYKDFYKIISSPENSSYGKLFYSSYKLWSQNLIFGVGVKNYRVDCDIEVKDEMLDNKAQLCSSHPHNFYLEILSETGIVGFILFFLFLLFFLYENFIMKRNYDLFRLGLLIYLFVKFIPISTSGSFFTTWNGSFIWLILGFILFKEDKTNTKTLLNNNNKLN